MIRKLKSLFLSLQVPSLLQQSFFSWKKNRSMAKATLPSCTESPGGLPQRVDLVSFHAVPVTKEKMIPKSQSIKFQVNNHSNKRIHRLRSLSHTKLHPSASVKPKRNTKQQRARSHTWLHMEPESDLDNILSLHTPVHHLEQFKETNYGEPLSLPLSFNNI